MQMKILIYAAAVALLFYYGRKPFYICSSTVCAVMCSWLCACMHAHRYRTEKKKKDSEEKKDKQVFMWEDIDQTGTFQLWKVIA